MATLHLKLLNFLFLHRITISNYSSILLIFIVSLLTYRSRYGVDDDRPNGVGEWRRHHGEVICAPKNKMSAVEISL